LLDSLSPGCPLHHNKPLSALAVSIDQEIKDLQLFGYTLREENRSLFEEMMSEISLKTWRKQALQRTRLK